jgi:hypothetical protein
MLLNMATVNKHKHLYFVVNYEHFMPEINNVRYGFQKQNFIRTDNGMPVDWEKMGSNTRKLGLGVKARAGEATTRQGAFFRTLISSESGERPRILEQALSGGRSLVKGNNAICS